MVSTAEEQVALDYEMERMKQGQVPLPMLAAEIEKQIQSGVQAEETPWQWWVDNGAMAEVISEPGAKRTMRAATASPRPKKRVSFARKRPEPVQVNHSPGLGRVKGQVRTSPRYYSLRSSA